MDYLYSPWADPGIVQAVPWNLLNGNENVRKPGVVTKIYTYLQILYICCCKKEKLKTDVKK